MDAGTVISAGILLILLGFFLVLAGSLASGEDRVEAGGVLFIGPVPVVFGSDRRMAGLALGLGIFTLGLLYLFSKGL